MTAKTTTYYMGLGKADALAGKPHSGKYAPGSWQGSCYDNGYNWTKADMAKEAAQEAAQGKPAAKPVAAQVEAKPTPAGLPRSATYHAQVKRLKAKGVKLVACSCPKCTKIIKTLPAPKGETWDSVAQCPHCEALFMKVTKGRKAWGILPPAKQD